MRFFVYESIARVSRPNFGVDFFFSSSSSLGPFYFLFMSLFFVCVIFFWFHVKQPRSSFTVFQLNLSFTKSLRLWIVADCMFYSSFFNIFYLKHICLALVIVTMCLCFHQLFSQTHKILSRANNKLAN